MSPRPWGPAVVPMGRGVLRAEVQDVPREWLQPPPGPGSQGTPSPPSATEKGHRARLRLPAKVAAGDTRPLLHRAPGDPPGATGCEVPAQPCNVDLAVEIMAGTLPFHWPLPALHMNGAQCRINLSY